MVLDISAEKPLQLSSTAISERIAVQTAYLERIQAEIQLMEFTARSVQNEIDSLKLLLIRTSKPGERNFLRSEIASSSNGSNVSQRNPMEMLKVEFKGMKLADIIQQVLANTRIPLTTTEICRAIYNTNSKEEFDRARNSLSTELRNGAKGNNPKWKKRGRNAYTAIGISCA